MADNATKAEIQAQLDALRKAMAQGVRQVDYQDYSVSYSTFEEMRRREQWLQYRIDRKDGTKRRRLIRLNTRKG